MNNVEEYYEHHAKTQSSNYLAWEELSKETKEWWINAYNDRHRKQHTEQGESVLSFWEDDFLFTKGQQ